MLLAIVHVTQYLSGMQGGWIDTAIEFGAVLCAAVQYKGPHGPVLPCKCLHKLTVVTMLLCLVCSLHWGATLQCWGELGQLYWRNSGGTAMHRQLPSCCTQRQAQHCLLWKWLGHQQCHGQVHSRNR